MIEVPVDEVGENADERTLLLWRLRYVTVGLSMAATMEVEATLRPSTLTDFANVVGEAFEALGGNEDDYLTDSEREREVAARAREATAHLGTMVGDRITCTCGYVTAAYPTSDQRHGEFNDHLAEMTQ